MKWEIGDVCIRRKGKESNRDWVCVVKTVFYLPKKYSFYCYTTGDFIQPVSSKKLVRPTPEIELSFHMIQRQHSCIPLRDLI